MRPGADKSLNRTRMRIFDRIRAARGCPPGATPPRERRGRRASAALVALALLPACTELEGREAGLRALPAVEMRRAELVEVLRRLSGRLDAPLSDSDLLRAHWMVARFAASPALAPEVEAVLRGLRAARSEPIEGTITFSVGDRPAPVTPPAEPVLALWMSTEDRYPCTGYGVAHETHAAGDSVVVRVLGAEPPPGLTCGAAFDHAAGEVPLPLSPGIHRLVFAYRDARDAYTLRVSERAVEVGPAEGRFTLAERLRAPRHLPGTLLVSCGSATLPSAGCVEAWRRLDAVPGLRPLALDDSASAFARTPLGRHTSHRHFVYADDGALRRAGRVLDAVGKELDPNENGYLLRLESWTGVVYDACQYEGCRHP